MNFISLLAQTPTLTPSVSPTAIATAKAIASVTPAPTSTATPFHVVMEQEPFWNSALGIFLVIVIAIVASLVIGLIARKGGTNGLVGKLFNLFNDFTDMLAYWVVFLGFAGIFLLSYFVLTTKGATVETAKYVFAAVLPLLGTWVGTVLAHYFQKENLAAATQSISDLASKVAGTDKLQATLAKDVMIKPDQISTLPDKYIGQKVKDVKAQASLSELVGYLKSVNKDRLPLFCDSQTNEDQQTYQKKGVAAGVVHVSTINAYIQAYTSLPAEAGKKDPTTLSLGDLISDDKCKYKAVFDNSFGLVAEDATLGRAKAVMENLTQKIPTGIKEGCYDIFVTNTGDAKETVLGWITNDIINGNAKV